MMRADQSINYTKLFSQLIDKNGQMDDTIASFLYYLFPRELFVRALSLIESYDMFIYVLDSENCLLDDRITTSVNTDVDEFTSSSSVGPTGNTLLDKERNSFHKVQDADPLVSMMYGNDFSVLHRLIVKSDNRDAPPIYVDLQNWFCSCNEYSELFAKETDAKETDEAENYIHRLTNEVTDIHEFSEDRFGQLDAHSLSKQRYFKHVKICCSHLLAFSLLLRSSKHVLHYFVAVKGQVPIIQVPSMDEWLKLHINIVA